MICRLISKGYSWEIHAYLHIPSYYCFHIFFYWASSAAPADERKKRHRYNEWTSPSLSNRHKDAHTNAQTKEIFSSVSGEFERRTVWSRWGQTVARHPEELPLYLCTATSCNLLLRDKTKLTWTFTADLTVLSGTAYQIAPDLTGGLKLTQQINDVYPSRWYSSYTHWHRSIKHFYSGAM